MRQVVRDDLGDVLRVARLGHHDQDVMKFRCGIFAGHDNVLSVTTSTTREIVVSDSG